MVLNSKGQLKYEHQIPVIYIYIYIHTHTHIQNLYIIIWFQEISPIQ